MICKKINVNRLGYDKVLIGRNVETIKGNYTNYKNPNGPVYLEFDGGRIIKVAFAIDDKNSFIIYINNLQRRDFLSHDDNYHRETKRTHYNSDWTIQKKYYCIERLTTLSMCGTFDNTPNYIKKAEDFAARFDFEKITLGAIKPLYKLIK